jgi:putative SOS response-associated peptidase YedK
MAQVYDAADYDAWLAAADPAMPQAMLRPFPSQLMRAYPVSKRVNSPKNDDAELIEPAA